MSREDFEGLDEARKERHAGWKDTNMKILDESSLEGYVTNAGESVLFREPGKPKVDFYPSTGRWRVAGLKKTFRGGAESFLAWYRKEVVE